MPVVIRLATIFDRKLDRLRLTLKLDMGLIGIHRIQFGYAIASQDGGDKLELDVLKTVGGDSADQHPGARLDQSLFRGFQILRTDWMIFKNGIYTGGYSLLG
jgi:hypothetical protein